MTKEIFLVLFQNLLNKFEARQDLMQTVLNKKNYIICIL